MRILITGASGLLGLNLALEAAGYGQAKAAAGKTVEHQVRHAVTGVTNRHGLQTDIFEVISADLLAEGTIERLLEQVQPDWVINCAALAVLDACEADPRLAYRLNAEFPAKLAEHVARGGARLVHVSTDAVFDGQKGDYRETDEPDPLGVYAKSKLEGERAVLAANPQALVARVNLFGWSLSGKRSLAEFFFYNLQAGKAVMGFTDVTFCPLLVNDLAWIFIEMLQRKLAGLYHVVSGECISKYTFGTAIARRFGFDESLVAPTSVEQAGLKVARSPNLSLRSDKLAAALGHPQPGLSPALDRLFTLYQQGYPQFIRGLGA